MEITTGTFYGVGVGPGDPELLTLKAVRTLQHCPVIATPQTASGRTLALEIAQGAVSLEGKTILPLPFIMQRDPQKLLAAHQAAAQVILEHLRAGQDVAMLNLGDVSIYSTYSYLMDELQQEGIAVEMVPGVPSFCAVAARLQTSLTTMNAPLHIFPAGAVDLDKALELPGTKVLMKTGRSMEPVLDALEKKNLLAKSALVEDCGLATEQAWTDLTDPPTETGYFTTIIVKE